VAHDWLVVDVEFCAINAAEKIARTRTETRGVNCWLNVTRSDLDYGHGCGVWARKRRLWTADGEVDGFDGRPDVVLLDGDMSLWRR
jgi:hypothetical protein